MVQRELIVVPLVVLISTGLTWLLRQRTAPMRAIAICVLAAMPLHFAVFVRDYFTHYQFRAATYFDSSNFREIARSLMAADAAERARPFT